MRRLSVRLLSAIAIVAPLGLHAQVGGFVVRLGQDTIVVERYTKSVGSIEGTLLRRSPFTALTKYSITLNPDGSVAKYTQLSTRGDGTALPTGSAQLTMTFVGDSVIREVVQNSQPVTFRAAVPKGTLPAFGASFLFAERQIQAARAGGDVHTIGFAASNVAATKVDVRLIRNDSAEIVQGGFRTGFRVDRGGRIRRADGSLTTQKFIVTPDARVDVVSLATAWMARDAAGQTMGAASTRDTVKATVGSANVMIEYGRPAKRGREIWGTLVPFDTTWRFGANAAAQLRTDKPLDIGGTIIPAGLFSIWLYPSAGQSYLIVNSQSGQWGTAYDTSKDVARIPVERVIGRPTAEERFRVAVEGNRLTMIWDTSGYAVRLAEK
jgi:Protein of unknown function (DUF2911)